MPWYNFWRSEKQAPKRRQAKRMYTAANVDRLTASWTTTPMPVDEVIKRNLRSLRARSREQMENNDYAKRFKNMVKSNVVGPSGATLQARTTFAENDTPDTLANNAIEAGWKQWGRREHCDISRRLSWVEQQQLFMTTLAEDGEVIVRMIRSRAAGKFRFALQFIDPELLDVEHNRPLAGGGFIKLGIEFDRWERPVAYHFIDADPGDSTYTYNGKKYRRVPAAQIIHRFIPERVGQSRGIPWMSTALLRMQMVGGYEEAALVNARQGASNMGFFSSPDGEGYEGDDVDADGNLITEAEPGTFRQLPNGVEFKAYDPAYPTGEFGPFIKSCLRGIASGLGVSYNVLSNDLEGVNFSSLRGGVLEDRELWKALQTWMIEAFHVPVYEAWLSMQLMAGTLTVGNGTLNPLREEKYRNVSWQPRRWGWVDPLKDEQANNLAVERRSRSVSSIIREQGGDPEEVWQEIARERERMKDLGIEPPPQPAQAGFFTSEENGDGPNTED